MNKLEEYRDKEADKQLVEGCQHDNHCFDCGCPAMEEGYKIGFDAAIKLGLAIKFEKWIMETSTGSIGDKHICKDLARSLNRESMAFTVNELYKYWIEKVFSPEQK